MKDTMVKGVPDYKIERLKKHLLKAEKMMGKPLRTTPRYKATLCPINNFEPTSYNEYGERQGGYFESDCTFGVLGIRRANSTFYIFAQAVKIYDEKDSWWWESLALKTRCAITKYISNWIKNEKKALP